VLCCAVSGCACRLEVPDVVEDTPPTPAPPALLQSKCAIQSYDVDHMKRDKNQMDAHMHACMHASIKTDAHACDL
jgi:hypothetical protein